MIIVTSTVIVQQIPFTAETLKIAPKGRKTYGLVNI
jgi:hypothetical protein